MNELTPHQSDALRQALAFARGETEHVLAVLVGPAGVGKTFVIAAFVRQLVEERWRVAVAAPTHRAVAVLAEKIGAGIAVKACTLHSLLGLQLVEREDGSAQCHPEGTPKLGDFDVIVVDESSMVDHAFFTQATAIAAGSGARILFCGDECQLPPVSDPRPSPVFDLPLRIELVEVVRQAKGSSIIGLASAIRGWIAENRWPTAADLTGAIPPTDGQLKPIAVHEGDGLDVRRFARLSIEAGYSTRIVAFTNAAVIAHNEAVHEALHGPDAPAFIVGEIVVAHREFSARRPGGGPIQRIANSAELTVSEVSVERHRDYPELDAVRLVLRPATGDTVEAWAPVDEHAFNLQIAVDRAQCAQLFEQAKALPKPEANRVHGQRMRLAAETSARKQAFAIVRHTYASTIHKLQGTTIDVAIIDLANLHRMRTVQFFTRALYTAITRARFGVSIIAPRQPSDCVPPPPPSPAVADRLADFHSVEGSSA